MQIRAQFRLFQVIAMFKQHLNLMNCTWILQLQTASRNKFPCKKGYSNMLKGTWVGDSLQHKLNDLFIISEIFSLLTFYQFMASLDQSDTADK